MEAEQEIAAEDRGRPSDLDERLGAIRTRGYEAMPSFQSESVFNLSAPVLGPGESAIAVLTCPFLPRVDRIDVPDREEALAILLEATRELSIVLGKGGEES